MLLTFGIHHHPLHYRSIVFKPGRKQERFTTSLHKMAQQITTHELVDSLTRQLVNREVSSSSSIVMEQILQAQFETDFQVERLKLQAAHAKTAPERMSCNLRVKALEILTARLRGVCGTSTNMPTEEQIQWARKHFCLQQ